MLFLITAFLLVALCFVFAFDVATTIKELNRKSNICTTKACIRAGIYNNNNNYDISLKRFLFYVIKQTQSWKIWTQMLIHVKIFMRLAAVRL